LPLKGEKLAPANPIFTDHYFLSHKIPADVVDPPDLETPGLEKIYNWGFDMKKFLNFV
jgi:hypothetical protein